ncbi:MAG: hypothetical protein LIO69_03265 [Oscillospiraceae bacterium]|nr:hypothetical protein [Oscillospiraceae bacterium]
MMQEVADGASGNFCGVCPILNRAAVIMSAVLRLDGIRPSASVLVPNKAVSCACGCSCGIYYSEEHF